MGYDVLPVPGGDRQGAPGGRTSAAEIHNSEKAVFRQNVNESWKTTKTLLEER